MVMIGSDALWAVMDGDGSGSRRDCETMEAW